MKDRLDTSPIKNILFTTVALLCYLALSVIANYALFELEAKTSNFPNEIAIGLPTFYSNFIFNSTPVLQNWSIVNLSYNFVFPSLILLICYCGYWLWIMPAETHWQRYTQLRLKCLVFYQIVIIGIEFLFLTMGILYEGNGSFALYFNVLVLYLVNLIIYIKYDRLEQKAEEIKEEEYKDCTY